jgi:hypothetical protein
MVSEAMFVKHGNFGGSERSLRDALDALFDV